MSLRLLKPFAPVLTALLLLSPVHAQMNMGKPDMGKPDMGKAAAAAMGDPAKAADSTLTGFEDEFMSAARAMPEAKYGFSPASLNLPGAKFDGTRTFAEQLKHVAQANYSIFAGVLGAKPDVDVKAIGNLKTKDEIVAALAGSFAFGHKAIATLTMANALEPVGRGQTKLTLALYAVGHGFDHYGQMVEYLRMNGIVPPASAR